MTGQSATNKTVQHKNDMTILLLLTGLLLIIGGANFLTDSASAIARRFGISEFVVGLTIVAIGTSAPELVISVISAIKGNSDIAIGNVIGSNMFNTLVIIGLTAVITPFTLTANNVRRDIPLGVIASVILLIVAGDIFINNDTAGIISRSEGLLMLCLSGFFIAYSFYSHSTQKDKNPSAGTNKSGIKQPSLYDNTSASVTIIILSLAALVGGGELFLDNVIKLAREFGISESVIAVTIVAGGTSLPELAASITAAVKKMPGMALGNALGSNIMNIFLVLGASAAISPLAMGGINIYDILVLLGSSVLLLFTAVTFGKRRIDRIEGVIFLILYAAYIWWILAR